MKNTLIFTALILNWIFLSTQENQLIKDDFGKNASIHVQKLCDFGTRIVGSEAETKTIDYLTEQFNDNKMNVILDTIVYKDYKLKNKSFILNDKKYQIKSAFINQSLNDTISIESIGVKLTNDDISFNSLTDKIVFSSTPSHSIKLSKYNPKAVIVMDENILNTLEFNDFDNIKIKFTGKSLSPWTKSYNVVATYKEKARTDSSVIITSHWDSRKGVGANDNASGTAALIELSKYFNKELSDLKYNLVFVATGLEEFGMLGAISYVLNNIDIVDKCVFNLNIDGVALNMPNIETSRIYSSEAQNIKSDTLQNILVFQNKTTNGILMTTREEIYWNRYTDKKRTERIRSQFERSMNESGFDYFDASCCSGVDARAFHHIGIPYIHLASSNPDFEDNVANTPEDVYNESFIENINLNGNIAIKILTDMNK